MALTKFRGFREPDDVNLLVRDEEVHLLDLTKVYTLCTMADHMYLELGACSSAQTPQSTSTWCSPGVQVSWDRTARSAGNDEARRWLR